MRKLLLLCLLLSSIILQAKDLDKSTFDEIEALIDSHAYSEADKRLNKIQNLISTSSPEAQVLYYCNVGYLKSQQQKLELALEALNNSMQIIYQKHWFHHEEHLRVAYLMANLYYLNDDYSTAERIINIALIRSSDIWENSKYSRFIYELLIHIYKKMNVSQGILNQLDSEKQTLPIKSNIVTKGWDTDERSTTVSTENPFAVEEYIARVDSISNYFANGLQFHLSEKVLDEADSTLLVHGLQNHPLKRVLYERRGQLRFLIKDIKGAKALLLKAKRIYDQENDCSSVEYGNCLNTLAVIYQEEGKMIYSTILLQASLANVKNGKSSSGRNYDVFGGILSVNDNLARNYYQMGDVQSALRHWNDIITMAEREGFWDNAISAVCNYTYAQIESGNISEAIKLLSQFVNKDMNFNLKESFLQNLLLSQFLANDSNILNTFDEYLNYTKSNLKLILSTYSERERENYWMEKSKVIDLISNAICWKYPTARQLRETYDNVLYTKPLLVQASHFLSDFCKKNIYSGIITDYRSYRHNRNRLLKRSIPNDSIPYLLEIISAQEKDILSKIPKESFVLIDSLVNSSSLRSKLKQNEVAIEFITIPEIFSIDSTSYYYGALITRQSLSHPIIIKLCEEYELENLFSECSSHGYSIKQRERLFQLLFLPLEKYIDKGDIVYYSPIGILHKINLEAIEYGGVRLFDLYKFNRLSTTGLLCKRKEKDDAFESAVEFGSINFDANFDNDCDANLKPFAENKISRSLYRNTWDYLPNSLKEVEVIDSVLKSQSVSTTLIIGNRADEKTLKGLSGSSPDILHLATHGFFYDQKGNNNNLFFDNIQGYTDMSIPMQYSGLLFSGANNAWIGKNIPDNEEDGILTAEEISQLDLSNTKLVVLSACDTGLGEINDVGGIYGLQLALKIAGVETIIMSLNKVDDEATQILMVEFYKNLMSGKSKYQSLRDAQKYLREVDNGKYDDPKYWAEFIMLDGLD